MLNSDVVQKRLTRIPLDIFITNMYTLFWTGPLYKNQYESVSIETDWRKNTWLQGRPTHYGLRTHIKQEVLQDLTALFL